MFRYVVIWQTPMMSAPAFWSYESQETAVRPGDRFATTRRSAVRGISRSRSADTASRVRSRTGS